MPSKKIDSNFTGLRFAKEAPGYVGYLPGDTHPEDGVLSGTPVWKPLEPNSYGDFGGQITTLARTPITASRQRSKGVTTDLDASAAFQIDFTEDNINELLPGYFFADWRVDATPRTSNAVVAVASTTAFGATGIHTDFAVGDIVFSKGFTSDNNNGAFLVSNVGTPGSLIVTNLSVAAPGLSIEANNANVLLHKVGKRYASAALSVDVTGPYPRILTASPSVDDFEAAGLVPGQWIYVGGDATANKFANANNNGFARVRAVGYDYVEFDKTQNTMTADAGTGKLIMLFFPDMIKNENDPTLIKTQSYQFERSASTAGYEYVKGGVPNTLAFNVATADKINVDLAFVATDHDPRDFGDRKTGSFPEIATSASAFNTSSDFSRIRTAEQGVSAAPLFAFITDLTMNINNNVTPAKAIGVLGAFDVNVGDFVVEGNITAYFSDMDAVRAVRNNADVTVDFALSKENAGWVFDIPLLTLGEGRLTVEKDAPITLPVSIAGAKHPTLLTTLQAMYFPYLPSAAAA